MPFLILDGKSQTQYFAVSGGGTEADPFYLYTTSSGGGGGGAVAGDVANDAVDSGNPVKIGGKAYDPSSMPANVASGDRVNASFDLYGRQITFANLALSGSLVTSGQKTAASSLPVVLPSNQDIALRTVTSGGCSISGFLSDNVSVSGVLKASAGQLYGMSMGNSGPSGYYVRLYNKASLPAGSDTPVYRFLVPGNTVDVGGGREKSWPQGAEFTSGIAYRITTTSGDNAATAVAAGLATVNFDYK